MLDLDLEKRWSKIIRKFFSSLNRGKCRNRLLRLIIRILPDFGLLPLNYDQARSAEVGYFDIAKYIKDKTDFELLMPGLFLFTEVQTAVTSNNLKDEQLRRLSYS